MNFILYILLSLIIFFPMWAAACWLCMDGPLQHLAIPWKMAVGAFTWGTAYLIIYAIFRPNQQNQRIQK